MPHRRPSGPSLSDSAALIEIDHVTFGYDSSRTILNDVSLKFGRGQSLVVWAIREGRQAAREVDGFLMGGSTLPR